MIKWQSWSKTAFAKAKKENKPILLAITAVWCHWCHTMDKEVYAKKAIANTINKNFIPIRVDTDERPDINDRYNVGGWPSTLILAPDGEPVSGATFVPSQHMKDFLADGIKRVKEYTPRERKPIKIPQRQTNPEEIYEEIVLHYDPIAGGFGLEPKFPHHDILEYLLWRVYAMRDKASAEMLKKSFDGMIKGELFDKVGGGFYRFVTKRNWTMPHFEKILEDNARLLSAYHHAHKLFRKDEYLTAANKTLFFLMTMLYDHKKGIFYGSQVADEAYCNLTLKNRLKAQPPSIDKRVFVDQNATMALTFFELAHADKEFARGAIRILEYLCKHIKGGVPHVLGKKVFLLRDTVYLLTALIQAHAWTNDDAWKLRAVVVAKQLLKFYDTKEGGFCDVMPNQKAIGRLKSLRKPVQENALAALGLNALAHVTETKKYALLGMKALEAVSTQASALGERAALYALAKSTIRAS